jgi:hypothetical protein
MLILGVESIFPFFQCRPYLSRAHKSKYLEAFYIIADEGEKPSIVVQ